MLTKTQRLILGSFVLLLVDIIWVSSSELTKVFYNIILETVCTYIINCFSTYIEMKRLKSRFFVHTLKRQCLRYIY